MPVESNPRSLANHRHVAEQRHRQRLNVGFENDRPVMVTYAEAGAYVLHQAAFGARPIDLGVFDNEFEVVAQLLARESA